jgi:hypothetical protein
MKTWFHGASPDAVALRAKWGDYPGLWKEVLDAAKALMEENPKRDRVSAFEEAFNDWVK